MTREQHSISEYKKVLTKAKQKYRDAIRGYEYSKELLRDSNIDSVSDYKFLEVGRDIFKAQMTIIEDIFGSENLNENK